MDETNNVDKIISRFPKKRITLNQAYKDIYSLHYKKNRDGETSVSFITKKMERWLHKMVASDNNSYSKKDISTLEIGAGTLNHLAYESSTQYDIVEPFDELYKSSKNLNQISKIYTDIFEICEGKYDRIISIATFEHILNLPLVIAKTCTLLNNNGVLRIAIPNEGSLLWKLAYELTTGIEFRLHYNLRYSTLMRYEHVNTATEIEILLSYFYKNVKQKSFGFGKHLALYRYFECNHPNLEKATQLINQKK